MAILIPVGKSFFTDRNPKTLFIKRYEALIPKVNIDLSKMTTGISEIQTLEGKLNAYRKAILPTECIVKVVPKLLAIKKRSRNRQAKKGISQKEL